MAQEDYGRMFMRLECVGWSNEDMRMKQVLKRKPQHAKMRETKIFPRKVMTHFDAEYAT